MNLSEIETFLTIVNTRSITKTADLLFLSQPTVSHRLHTLEEELGFALIIRKKGYKQVELTPKGMEFIPIAERWMYLWKETVALKSNYERLPLVIGCTDSLHTALLAPLYRQILSRHSALDLDLRTHQSSELYRLLGEHVIDIGFVYHVLRYKNITVEKIYEEKMYLVQSDQAAHLSPLVHIDDLDPSLELFLSWNDSFQIWHDRWFSADSRPHIVVDTITMMDKLWHHPHHWTIAPESAIEELSRHRLLYVSELDNPPPPRACYKISHRSPRLTANRAVTYFEELLTAYLAERRFDLPIGKVFGADS